MERDYFKDRPVECTMLKEVSLGDFVYICTKDMQKTACKMEHLTFGKVIRILTSQEVHTAGIKVTIQEYVKCSDGKYRKTLEDKVGRITYLIRDGKILTK